MFNNYFPTKKNKHQKQVKARFEDDIDTSGGYIDTPMNSSHHVFDDAPELEAELRGSVHDMRQQFRSTSKRLRGLYANK